MLFVIEDYVGFTDNMDAHLPRSRTDYQIVT